MSKLALGVQAMVAELAKKKGGKEMAKQPVKKSPTGKTPKRPQPGRVKATKKTKRRKPKDEASTGGRILKAYKLTGELADDYIRKGSVGREILDAIQQHEIATKAQIREVVGKKIPDPTIRFYLGKFQREKVVKTVAA